MSKESIKRTIDDNIFQNGQQRITGSVMNSVLNEMVENEYGELNQLALKMDDKAEKADIAPIVNDSNSNSDDLEVKVNALIAWANDIIKKIVFHSGTPYKMPQELQTLLSLKRLAPFDINTTSICGVAVCGNAITGNK